ncbi:MAG: hypothetical protein QNJ30_24135 [Kiloniellales bacterium]|nr:hypothetical protein [Kiloniellales bacterium]
MKINRFLGSALVMLLLAAPALPSRTLAAADEAASVSFAGVKEFDAAGGGVVDGATILHRGAEGVAYTFSTRDLQRAAPYTNWWVTFNNPEACTTPCACSDVDFENAAVDIGVFLATGRVSNGFGQAEFAAEIDYGELPDGRDQVPFAPAFASPIEPGAEIHLIVRAHGPRLFGAALEAQLTQFNGGCPPHPVDSLDGCIDVQFSVHRSPQCKAGDDDDDDD